MGEIAKDATVRKIDVSQISTHDAGTTKVRKDEKVLPENRGEDIRLPPVSRRILDNNALDW